MILKSLRIWKCSNTVLPPPSVLCPFLFGFVPWETDPSTNWAPLPSCCRSALPKGKHQHETGGCGGREINVFLSHALPALAPGFWARLYPVIMIAMFGCPYLPGLSCQWTLITQFLPFAQISSLSSRLWMLQPSLVPITMPMLLEVVCIKSLFR